MYMDWEAGTWVPLPEEWARMLDATEDIIPDVQNAVVSFYIISYTVREMCGLFFLHLAINPLKEVVTVLRCNVAKLGRR